MSRRSAEDPATCAGVSPGLASIIEWRSGRESPGIDPQPLNLVWDVVLPSTDKTIFFVGSL